MVGLGIVDTDGALVRKSMSSRLARCDVKTFLVHRCRRQYRAICSTEVIAHAANQIPIIVTEAVCRTRVGRSFCLITSQTNTTPEMLILMTAMLAPAATNPKVVVFDPILWLASFFTKNAQSKARSAKSSTLMAKVM